MCLKPLEPRFDVPQPVVDIVSTLLSELAKNVAKRIGQYCKAPTDVTARCWATIIVAKEVELVYHWTPSMYATAPARRAPKATSAVRRTAITSVWNKLPAGAATAFGDPAVPTWPGVSEK